MVFSKLETMKFAVFFQIMVSVFKSQLTKQSWSSEKHNLPPKISH